MEYLKWLSDGDNWFVAVVVLGVFFWGVRGTIRTLQKRDDPDED